MNWGYQHQAIPQALLMQNPMFPPLQPFQQYVPMGQPDLGNPLANMAMGLLGPMLGNMLGMSAPNNLTLTAFGALPGGNVYNNLRMQQQSADYARAIRGSFDWTDGAVSPDMSTMIDTLRGAAANFNMPFNEVATEASLRHISRFLGPSWGPKLGNTLGAGRSQASIVGGLFLAGQGLVDPRSGSMGWSADMADAAGRDLYRGLGFADKDPMVWRRATRGFDSEQVGDITREMTRRGMLSESDYQARPDGTVNTRAAQQKIKDATKALSVVREMFGEAGQEGTISDFWNVLEKVSSGAMYQMSGDRVEMQMRKLKEAARTSGVGLEGMVAMAGMTGSLFQQMGLPMSWAMNATTEALLFKSATGAMGYGTPAWGRESGEQMMAGRTQLEAANRNAAITGRFGLVRRLDAEYGHRMTAEQRANVRGLIAQIESGAAPSSLVGGEGTALRAIADASGLSPEALRELSQQTDRNRMFADQYDPGGLSAAGIDAARQNLGSVLTSSRDLVLGRQLRDFGVNSRTSGAHSLVRGLSDVMDSIYRTAGENGLDMRNEDVRRAAVVPAMRRKLEEMAAAGNQAAIMALRSSTNIDADLAAAESSAMGMADVTIRQLSGGRDGAFSLYERTSDGSAMDAQRRQNSVAAKAGAATSWLFQNGAISRAWASLNEQGLDPTKANFKETLRKTLNIHDEDVLEAMSGGVMAQKQAWDRHNERLKEFGDDKFSLDMDKVRAGVSRDEQLAEFKKRQAAGQAASYARYTDEVAVAEELVLSGASLAELQAAKEQAEAIDAKQQEDAEKVRAGDTAAAGAKGPETIMIAADKLILEGRVIAEDVTTEVAVRGGADSADRVPTDEVIV